LIDPELTDETEKNDELHELELKCIALGKSPEDLFKDQNSKYVSLQRATEVMRTIEKRSEEIHQMARSFREKYEFARE
jgi:hypothetical protein